MKIIFFIICMACNLLFASDLNRLGQHQSQWILMKDAALDKDPQSIIFKVFIAVG